MRSVRLDPELEAKIARAAEQEQETVSEFLRRAAAARADAVLDEPASASFADVAGAINGGGGRARRSGEAFVETIAERASKR